MRIALLLFLTAFLFSPVHAKADHHDLVQIKLIPETYTVEPGQEIWVGTAQTIKPGWHTYWKNPGDSGTAPRLNWRMPDGFQMGEIHWPVPEKLPYGSLLNYGYEDRAVLLQTLTVPDPIPAGPIALEVDAEILVCADTCIPVFLDSTLILNDTASEPARDIAPVIRDALMQLPETLDMPLHYYEQDGDFMLVVGGGASTDLNNPVMFPADWGVVENAAPVLAYEDQGDLIIRQKRGDRSLAELASLSGVLMYQTAQGQKDAFRFTALPGAQGISPAPGTDHNMPASVSQIVKVLFLAFLGGAILNLMPCVFPVLSIKALSLVKTAAQNPAAARLHGVSYTAGVVLSFALVAAALIAFRAAGAEVGWGFQLQNPVFVSLMAYVLFLVGLNFSGFFDIGTAFSNVGQKQISQGTGLKQSFLTGVLAALVAAPCTAPFMAVAVGFALAQPVVIAVLTFVVLGFGLAAPYLLLALWPGAHRVLPRPGAWMEIFRQLLAFPMFLSAAWLVWVLAQQAGALSVLWVLCGAISITFALWLFQNQPQAGPYKILVRLGAVFFLLLPGYGLYGASFTAQAPEAQSAQSAQDTDTFGAMFSTEALTALLADTDDPVFVEMTAAWCITCKVNHATSLNIQDTRDLFADQNVQYLIGDWTRYDPEITRFLNGHGHNGVPLYVYYGVRDAETGKRPAPYILPQILTPQIVRDVIKPAA